jgi:hypothetical protein
VLENRVLKKIYGPKMNEITEEWRRLLNQELCNMFSSDVIWVIRLRRMRWADCVACMAERTMYIGFWWKNLRERTHLEVLGEERRIIVK